MTSVKPSPRYRAASMELAAYLDDRYVEMRIVTDTGEAIAVVCPYDSIFTVKRHIEKIGHDCPEIASWGHAPTEPTRDSAQVRTAA